MDNFHKKTKIDDLPPLQEIYKNLCFYDVRNPNNNLEFGGKSEKCFCDNCFYGRDFLAQQIISLYGRLP